MTLDEIRKLVAERRTTIPYVQGAGARARWRQLCDMANALADVVEGLPNCEAVEGCGPALRDYDAPGNRQLICDGHAPTDDLYAKYPYREKYISDLPYASALRALMRKS